MKIFYFPSFYPSDRPGEKWTGAFTHRQVKALLEVGADVEVVVPQQDCGFWPLNDFFADWKNNKKQLHPIRRVFDGVQIHHPRIPSYKPNRFFSDYAYYYTKATAQYLRPRIPRDKPVYFFTQWLTEAGLVILTGKELNIKTAVMGIGDDVIKIPLENDRGMASFRWTWEQADMRSVVADYLGREANRISGVNLPYEVFYSSVDTREFHPVNESEKLALRRKLGLPEDKVIILGVGSPIVRKGWLDLFNALACIKRDDYVLAAVNGGAQELDLNEEARKRGLSTQFINLREIPTLDMPMYYQMADIFCLPSHWEGLANALLEAMATGLPCITTNVSGHPEVVTDGVNGYLINMGDVPVLSERLKALISDMVLRTAIGKTAAQSVQLKPGTHVSTASKIINALHRLQ